MSTYQSRPIPSRWRRQAVLARKRRADEAARRAWLREMEFYERMMRDLTFAVEPKPPRKHWWQR